MIWHDNSGHHAASRSKKTLAVSIAPSQISPNQAIVGAVEDLSVGVGPVGDEVLSHQVGLSRRKTFNGDEY